ncbi:MAG TPA: phage portal protein [Gemmataceae bacterium]|nr:phage portal protein [Gemmataceae bacterium]
MDANANGREDKLLSLKEIREQKRLIRAKLELHQLKNAERVLEASANWDYWLSSYVDLLDRYRDGGRLAYPIGQPTDRRYGQNWPFWNTETQLSLLRAQARLLCTMNGYAIGLLSGLQAYVIGDGFQYRIVDRKSQNDTKNSAKPSPFALKVQEIIDEFCDVNDWSEWERELFWRSREDGEFFLRFYPDNDNRCMTVRCVEPEQVSMTGVPEATQEHWSFGIHTDPEDVQTVYGYNVLYMADPSNHANQIREEVPIEEMLHFKINVKRTVKRGLSDFAFSTHDAFTVAEKLRNNMAEGAAVQSALAYIRQHESATQAQIQNFLNTQQIDFTRANPLTGQQINYKQFEPGTIADIPRGMQYVQPPGAGNASGFIDILHATLRGAGCRWNAPEWLATGSGADMAAYTASLTAHAPFVRSATQKQNAYKKVFTQVLWEAIEYAIDYGRLPMDTPHLIDIQCEAPSILARDEQDEAQANQIRVTGGWKSRQTVQQEEGLDPEQEMQNIEAFNERFGQGAQSGKAGPVPVQEANFNPDEPRDERGRWTKAGQGAAAAVPAPNAQRWDDRQFNIPAPLITPLAHHVPDGQERPVADGAGSVHGEKPLKPLPKEMEEYYAKVEKAIADALKATEHYKKLLEKREQEAKANGQMTMAERRTEALKLKMRLAKLERDRLNRLPTSWSEILAGAGPMPPSELELRLQSRISRLEDPAWTMVNGDPEQDGALIKARRDAYGAWSDVRWKMLDKPPGFQTSDEFRELEDMIEPGRKGLLTPSQAGDLVDPIELVAGLGAGWIMKVPALRIGAAPKAGLGFGAPYVIKGGKPLEGAEVLFEDAAKALGGTGKTFFDRLEATAQLGPKEYARFVVNPKTGERVIQFGPQVANMTRDDQLRLALHELGHGAQYNEFVKEFSNKAIATREWNHLVATNRLWYARMEISTELETLNTLGKMGLRTPQMDKSFMDYIKQYAEAIMHETEHH